MAANTDAALLQRADLDAAAKSRLGCCRKEQTWMLPQRADLDAAAKSRLNAAARSNLTCTKSRRRCCCKIKLDLHKEQTQMLLQDQTDDVEAEQTVSASTIDATVRKLLVQLAATE